MQTQMQKQIKQQESKHDLSFPADPPSVGLEKTQKNTCSGIHFKRVLLICDGTHKTRAKLKELVDEIPLRGKIVEIEVSYKVMEI